MAEGIEEFRNSFNKVKMCPSNRRWENCIKRENTIEKRNNDIRTDFGRDYTRLIHTLGYRRLKHKTQVFFAPENDHICTRIEHVTHVESVSFTIANFLGLNTELTKAISIGHDIGHAPFGHLGEKILSDISYKELHCKFWHEKNGLHFVDDVEYLLDSHKNYTNLNLTYAVRDGIISHCGEVDANKIRPRRKYIDLNTFNKCGKYQPYTWEGCVVKYSDKISYLGRDIEDALKLNVISVNDISSLVKQASEVFNSKFVDITTTGLLHLFIIDLCKNSSIENGLCLSDPVHNFMEDVMKFNNDEIYKSNRLDAYKKYAKLALNQIYDFLMQGYNGDDTLQKINDLRKKYYNVFEDFYNWITNRWDLEPHTVHNKLNVVYHVFDSEQEYKRAVIDFIAGMTDNYANKIYNNICTLSPSVDETIIK